jgi:hypothetical protein
MTQYAESGSSGVWDTQSEVFVDVPNLQVTINTSGGPVLIQLAPATDESTISCGSATGPATFSFFRFRRDGFTLPYVMIGSALNIGAPGSSLFLPCSALSAIDNPAAGTHVYGLQARSADKSVTGPPHSTRIQFAKLAVIAF